MKIPKSLCVTAICLLFVGQAYATASYDASFDLKVGFSQVWDAVTFSAIPSSKSGTGEFTADNVYNITITALPSQEVSAHAFGTAGDATGSLGGTSQASQTADFLSNFTFPELTTFTITVLNAGGTTFTNAPFLGDSAEAMFSFDILLDGVDITDQLLNSPNSSAEFSLTAGHTVELTAFASGDAASPGSAVPEPATMFLLASGLLGLRGARRKFRK